MTKDRESGLKLPLYDARLIEKNLRKGLIDKKEYEAYIKKLSDEEANAEYVEFVDETTADVDSDEGTPTPEELTFT